MALLNRLEPLELIHAFQAHPPEGFTSIDFPAPAFATKFDLLTTLEPAVRKRLDARPQWLLRPVTCFIGTTVSEYALFPAEVSPEELVRAIVAELAPRYSFVIIKDLPAEPVLVGEESATYARHLGEACRKHGFVLMGGQALAWVPIDFASIDEFLGRFSHARRKNLRRKLRSARDVEVDAIVTGDERFLDNAFVASIYALYRNVHAQSEIHFDLLSEDFFRAVLRSTIGTLFLYRVNGALIGWNLCVEENEMLIDKYIGFDYPAAREHDLYAVSWFHNLEYALQRGYRCYVAGWTDPEIKRQLGARFTPTLHAVRVRNPLLRAILKLTQRWFEPDRRWYSDDADARS